MFPRFTMNFYIIRCIFSDSNNNLKQNRFNRQLVLSDIHLTSYPAVFNARGITHLAWSYYRQNSEANESPWLGASRRDNFAVSPAATG